MTYAKKQLGQNFLKDKRALEKIVTAADLDEGETVLEIGPGRGALTKGLLETGVKVIAVEKDPEMLSVLEEKFPDEIAFGNLVLHEGDILTSDLASYGFTDHSFKVVANIPYYITGAIIRSLLQTDIQPSSMVLLVQQEVAERIVGGKKRNKESILSLSVKVYGTPKYVATVSKKAFSPSPKVDSAVLLISDISRGVFQNSTISEEKYFEYIKNAFAQKRKTLVNNIKNAGLDTEHLKKMLNDLAYQETVRAEDILADDWTKLTLI